jgi:hypothetical protein
MERWNGRIGRHEEFYPLLDKDGVTGVPGLYSEGWRARLDSNQRPRA